MAQLPYRRLVGKWHGPRRNLDVRSIYPRCGAEATKNRPGEGWRVRKAADVQDRSALRLLTLHLDSGGLLRCTIAVVGAVTTTIGN